MATLAANLRHAAAVMADLGVRVVVEPINTRDRPGIFLSSSNQALEAIDWAGHANLALQYDVYHMQIMEGDLAPTIQRSLSHIGHIQIADTPGRHEPGSGEINYPFLFQHLDRLGEGGVPDRGSGGDHDHDQEEECLHEHCESSWPPWIVASPRETCGWSKNLVLARGAPSPREYPVRPIPPNGRRSSPTKVLRCAT